MKSVMIALLLCPVYVLGQSLDSTKFEVIKLSAQFLITDPKISQHPEYKIACSLISYRCLESQVTDEQGFKGIAGKVRKWRRATIKSWNDLTNLKTTIWEDIILPKTYRQQLPGYVVYERTITKLLTAPKTKPSRHDESRSTGVKQRVPSTSDLDTTENLQSDSIPADPAGSPYYQLDPTPSFMEDNMPIISLAFSLVAIIISFFAVARKPAKRSKDSKPLTYTPDFSHMEAQLNRLKGELETLSAKLVKDQESFVRTVEAQLQEASIPKSNTMEWAINRKDEMTLTQNTVDQAEMASASPSTVTKYAKYSDIRDGGFTTSILRDIQNGEQTYHLELTGGEGIYMIAEDTKAQKYALQNYEYLSNACEIKNQVQSNSKIITVQRGVLRKMPDQSWIIENRATIEFK